MLLEIDPHSETPIYQQICNQLIVGIAQGKLVPGETLPSVRQLADEIGVNMMTVSKSYSSLKNDGYILTDRRNGTKVAPFQYASKEIDHYLYKEFELLLAKAHIYQVEEKEVQKKIKSIYQKFQK